MVGLQGMSGSKEKIQGMEEVYRISILFLMGYQSYVEFNCSRE